MYLRNAGIGTRRYFQQLALWGWVLLVWVGFLAFSDMALAGINTWTKAQFYYDHVYALAIDPQGPILFMLLSATLRGIPLLAKVKYIKAWMGEPVGAISAQHRKVLALLKKLLPTPNSLISSIWLLPQGCIRALMEELRGIISVP